MKEYLLYYLRSKGAQSDQEVLKMVITLLNKIIKLAWFDQQALRMTVRDLIKLQTLGERHLWISLTALHDLIIEMSCLNRAGNLSVHRRTALSFRDNALTDIFKQSLVQI